LRTAVQERDDNGNKSIALSKTTYYRPGTLVIIDSEYVLWEIDERIHSPQQATPNQIRMRGFLVIHDPTGTEIKPFVDFFQELAGTASVVLASELP
jgi:hypothetical protein